MRLLRFFYRALLRTVPLGDPWERFDYAVPLRVFGAGAQRDFPWYFEGKSCVDAASLEAVLDWLLGCEYVRDAELFQEADFWQHPCTFEQLRKGDCEDFALWTWRKLIELGYEAELMAGRCRNAPGRMPGHAWIVFHEGGTAYLFDPVVRERPRIIRPLETVRHGYLPEVSVDRRFNRYVYAGYFQHASAAAQTAASVASVPLAACD